MRTIRTQLLVGLCAGGLACIVAAGALLYAGAHEEANELSDLQLSQIAATLPNQFANGVALPAADEPEEAITIQVWTRDGALLYASQEHLRLPRYGASGFKTVKLGGDRWRVYCETRGERYIQVSQQTEERDELAAKLALRSTLPLLIFIPILGLMIYVVVGRALRPLERVASAVSGRSASALQAFGVDDLPSDLRPIVQSLNGLLARIDEAMRLQRTFVADAAHELRSPLTALKLQLQLAERAGDDQARAEAFDKLNLRLDRAAHLVQQLLTLARHETGSPPPRMAPLDLHRLAQDIVGEHSTLAESRDIDLGVDARSGSVAIQGHADSLAILLNNLVDNALRYTPAGGQVDVLATVEDGRPVLRVSDNGPGVPEHERARLFDRFYRPDGNAVWGCGLGLSIVKNIADAHGAAITLGDGGEGRGLVVSLVFPAQA